MSNAMMDPTPTDWNGQIMQKRIARRYAAERRFKAMGFLAVSLSTLFLAFLLFTMLGQGLLAGSAQALGYFSRQLHGAEPCAHALTKAVCIR